MTPNDHEDNKKRSAGSPGNVVDLTALLRRRREERERFERGEDLPDDEFPEIPFPDEADYDSGDPDPEDSDDPGWEEDEPRQKRRHNPPKKKKSLRQIIGDVLITAVLLILIAAAVILIGASLISIEKITVTGTAWTEEEPILDWYFPTEKSRILSRAVLKNLLGRPRPPVFSDTEVVLTGLKECEIRVTEKEAAFVIGMKNEEGILVLTEDGEVLRKVPEVPEHLALIAGIGAVSEDPLLPALTDQPETFTQLLRVIRLLQEYEIESDELFIRDGGFCLQIKDVTVCLGTDERLREKLTELKNQIPAFVRLRGTLHLEDYDEEKGKDGFTFEVSP